MGQIKGVEPTVGYAYDVSHGQDQDAAQLARLGKKSVLKVKMPVEDASSFRSEKTPRVSAPTNRRPR